MQKLIKFLAPKKVFIAVFLAAGYHLFAVYSVGQPAGTAGSPVPADNVPAETAAGSDTNVNDAAIADNNVDTVADQAGQPQNQTDQQQAESEQSNNVVDEVEAETAGADEGTVDAAEVFANFLSNNGGNIQAALGEAVESAPDMYAEFMNISIDRGLDPITAAELVAQALGEEVAAVSTAGIDAEAADPSASVSSFASSAGGGQRASAAIRPSIPPTSPIASASPAR